MKFHYLLILSSLVLAKSVSAYDPTLILMGGSYQTCSSLDNDDCKPGQAQFPNARQPAKYQIDAKAFVTILNPSYWLTRDRPPSISAIETMLQAAYLQANDKKYNSADLMQLFETVAPATWRALVVPEQDMILSAFEIPQFQQGLRLKEATLLDGSIHGYDAALFRRLVQEAAKRSNGRKPRVAFVTSAASNNFDAVDFYRDLLQQAGADVIWWPVDASMNAAIFGKQGCDALPNLRQQIFSQLGRERVFPDLNDQQRQACIQADQLAQVPLQVDALFLDGGDQWLHWNTFFSTDGQPNLWLQNIRTAYQKGELVVAGTSAGTAVQSSPVMITNGTFSNALKRGAKQYAGMPEGCDQAMRCPENMLEDDFTYWPQAGFALAGQLIMDTHVSKRNRELRLLTLLNTVQADAGIGTDETSAVILRFEKTKTHIESLGMSGAWWFMKPNLSDEPGSYSLKAHYLAPGKILQLQNGKMQAMDTPSFQVKPNTPSKTSDVSEPNAMRDAVWNMVINQSSSAKLNAYGHNIQITSTADSKYWQGPEHQQGITDLHIEVSRVNTIDN